MRLFSTDIDGTILDGPESASLFDTFWSSLGTSQEPPLLVYNTGRALEDTLNLIATTALPEPDFFICGVGTVIYDASEESLLNAWDEQLDHDWNFEAVVEAVSAATPAKPQPRACQGPHKSSWFWKDADLDSIRAIIENLHSLGIEAQAVYSSNRDLDFIPRRANKGNAVEWLGRHLGIANEEIIVAGDSGNDASMYRVEGARGVLVSNAEVALIESLTDLSPFRATKPCAAGVVEGLTHHLGENRERNPDTPAR